MLIWIQMDKNIGIYVIDVWINTLVNRVHTSARRDWPSPGVRCLKTRQPVCVQTTIKPLVCQTNELRLPVISALAFASLCFLYGRALGKRCHKRKWSAALWGTWLHTVGDWVEDEDSWTNQCSVRTQGHTSQSLFWPVLTIPHAGGKVQAGCPKCLKKSLNYALTQLHS